MGRFHGSGGRHWARTSPPLAASLTGHDPRRPNLDATVPWIVQNITVSNNVFGMGGIFQIYAMDNAMKLSADAMCITISGNLFNRWLSGSPIRMVGWGGVDNSSVTHYATPEVLAAAKNPGWHNAGVNPSMEIGAMSSAESTYAGVAIGVPSDIASLLGQAPGAPKR